MTTQAAPLASTRITPSLPGPVHRLFATRADAAATILRLTLAAAMFPHGAQKLLGWFGGYGWSGTMGFFTDKVGLPAPLAGFIILLEFFGPLLLVAGFATRLVGLGFIALMIGAVVKGGHYANGFFMNWYGNQPGEGIEYHLLVVGIALALVVRGAGSLSVDRFITRD